MIRDEMITARLTLRPVTFEDEGAVVACLNDLSVTGWLSLVPYPFGPKDFRHFLTKIARPGYDYAVVDDSGFTGIVGISEGNGQGRELGYWFEVRSHGKDYATEAARSVLAQHLAANHQDIVSGHFEGNTQPANVLGKIGFVEVGRRRRICLTWGGDRPHVDMRLTEAAFLAACSNGETP